MNDVPSNDKPNPASLPFNVPNLSSEELKARAEEILKDQPVEVQKAVEKSKSFYATNRPIILTGLVVLTVMKVNKRMVKKAVAKAYDRDMPSIIDTVAAELNGPSMFDVLQSLRDTPGMAYIPHGGGMVHLLKGKDAIVTVFGEFEKMTNDQIWNAVANILNLNVRV